MAETKGPKQSSRTVTLSERVQTFFHHTATRLGHTTQWVQRTSKLTAARFAQIWVLGFAADPHAALSDLAADAADLGIAISAQGLDQRINARAVTFFQRLFAEAVQGFRNDLPLAVPVLQQFTAIYVQDSSVIPLPDSLQQDFPGCGGTGASAALKVQLLVEFLQGNLEALSVHAGRSHDQAGAVSLDYLPAGALLIRDLGYYFLEHFRTISNKKAYFISRLKVCTTVYDPDSPTPLDLVQELRREPRLLFERPLLLGANLRLPVRAIFVHLPKEVAAERRRKAKADAEDKGITLQPRTLELLDWNIFITNVPASMLSAAQVPLLYSVRWQIELLFKLWKSEWELAHVTGWRRERVLCELYAKLIGLVLLQWFIAPLRLSERELSAPKAAGLWKRYATSLALAFTSRRRLTTVFETLLARMKRFALKDQRQTNRSTLQQLTLEIVPTVG